MRLRRKHSGIDITGSIGRRGTMAAEMLLVLPIMLALLAGMFEFGLLLHCREQMLAASRAGARVAAQGGNETEVKKTVKRILGTGRLGDAEVGIERVPEDPEQPTEGRDRVVVCVHVETTHVVPDLLAWIGISFRGEELVAATIMNQE